MSGRLNDLLSISINIGLFKWFEEIAQLTSQKLEKQSLPRSTLRVNEAEVGGFV